MRIMYNIILYMAMKLNYRCYSTQQLDLLSVIECNIGISLVIVVVFIFLDFQGITEFEIKRMFIDGISGRKGKEREGRRVRTGERVLRTLSIFEKIVRVWIRISSQYFIFIYKQYLYFYDAVIFFFRFQL